VGICGVLYVRQRSRLYPFPPLYPGDCDVAEGAGLFELSVYIVERSFAKGKKDTTEKSEIENVTKNFQTLSTCGDGSWSEVFESLYPSAPCLASKMRDRALDALLRFTRTGLRCTDETRRRKRDESVTCGS
jgi:hypothetical protein